MENEHLFRVAEVQLSYKQIHPPDKCPQVRSSKDAYRIVKGAWDDDTLDYIENFILLLLKRNNAVFGMSRISIGGVTGTIVDLRVIFGIALKAGASGIIISHNHPSGNLSPSMADKEITRRIRQGGEILDINLLDHIILTRHGYYSFADEGIL